jgi:hypothetical protein
LVTPAAYAARTSSAVGVPSVTIFRNRNAARSGSGIGAVSRFARTASTVALPSSCDATAP